MAADAERIPCATCIKERGIAKCAGCARNFCLKHLNEHRQVLTNQLDGIETSRDLFQQTLIQQKTEPQQHPLIQHINQWEEESIVRIRQAAEDARVLAGTYIDEHATQLGEKLAKLTAQLQRSRETDDIIETDLENWKEQLEQLEDHFKKPSHITIERRPTALINAIDVVQSAELVNHTAFFESKTFSFNRHYSHVFSFLASLSLPTITRWVQNGITVAGGNGQGHELNQLSDPWGIFVDDDLTIYIADRSNHRIVAWKNNATSGRIVAGGNGDGYRNDQLNRPVNVIVDQATDSLLICDYGNRRVVRWPRHKGTAGETIISNISCWGLAMDNQGRLYVSDVNKNEVRRYDECDTTGTVVAGGNGRGRHLEQLNGPYYIAVDQEHSVYIPDCNNHRVMKWKDGMKKGTMIAGDQDYGKGETELSGPYSVILDPLGTIYIADCNNNRIMRWHKGATSGNLVVGGNGTGKRMHQFNSPCDLAFDKQRNLYVVDNNNHRVQKFPIDTK